MEPLLEEIESRAVLAKKFVGKGFMDLVGIAHIYILDHKDLR